MNGNTASIPVLSPTSRTFSRLIFCYLLLFLILLPALGCGKPKELSPQEKVKNLKAQVKDNPDDAEAHYQLGVLYLIVENYADAVNQFKDATRLNKDHALAYRDLAVAYYFSNQYDEAEKWLKRRP